MTALRYLVVGQNVKWSFFLVRAAAGTLAVGNAAPVNVPFALQTS